jgi:hypothetical protein
MKKDKSDEWLIEDYENRSEEDSLGYAHTVSPYVGVIGAIKNFSCKTSGFDGILEGLEKAASMTLGEGSVDRYEEMLFLQAELLNHVFVQSISIVGSNSEVAVAKAYAAIALKAQNQSRRTIAALNDMKNPKRTTFIKQQNNAHNQQVNNGNVDDVRQVKKTVDRTTKEKSLEKNKANELLGELNDGICMDARKTAKAKRSN